MSDWKQITARIRRARTGKDPAGQLSNLYQKTRDAMVAFELARHFETAGNPSDATQWYRTAAERFRRADWKTKANEAIARLTGAPTEEVPAGSAPSETGADLSVSSPELPPMVLPEPGVPFLQNASEFEALVSAEPQEEAPQAQTTPPADSEAQRRQRGRRGGRNRRGRGGSRTATLTPASSSRRSAHEPEPDRAVSEARETHSDHVAKSLASLRAPVEGATAEPGAAVRSRSGDPGLSSRLSLLEMQFRRLLTCPPTKLDEASHAPVGPGVLLVTDSDLTTYYYVEACQTLRIAIPNLLRGNSSRRGEDSLKPRLAEHLGIPEARVSKYLSEHCVARWLQLDEGAAYFAHFVIAVLRPLLNE